MKRIICFLLVVCLIPACASAINITMFNEFVSFFGEEKLESGKEINESIVFSSNGCLILFEEDETGNIKTITVGGSGDSFLAYSLAAVMYFDQSTANFEKNAGKLFVAFLMCRASETERVATLEAGATLVLGKNGSDYVCMLMR